VNSVRGDQVNRGAENQAEFVPQAYELEKANLASRAELNEEAQMPQHEPVAIGRLESFAAGPAGLTCAGDVARFGYDVYWSCFANTEDRGAGAPRT
jgi:hypothetical protein